MPLRWISSAVMMEMALGACVTGSSRREAETTIGISCQRSNSGDDSASDADGPVDDSSGAGALVSGGDSVGGGEAGSAARAGSARATVTSAIANGRQAGHAIADPPIPSPT